jgi:glycogen phosphorylase
VRLSIIIFIYLLLTVITHKLLIIKMGEELKKYQPLLLSMTMESYAQQDIPTYSGGLGVLVGDITRSYADLRMPMAVVAQGSSKGYCKTHLDGNGWQNDHSIDWGLHTLGKINEYITIETQRGPIYVTGYIHETKGETGYKVPTLLLDTDHPKNSEENRKITHKLYDNSQKLLQEIVLGLAGVRLPKKLWPSIEMYHMNEGHAAFASLELLSQLGREKEVKKICFFTTHTPVPAGHDKWDYGLIESIMGKGFLPENIRQLAGEDNLNMTRLAYKLSNRTNGVSLRHSQVCNNMEVFKDEGKVSCITNGIHPRTWASDLMKELFDDYLRYWGLEPRVFAKSNRIPNNELLEAKKLQKADMVRWINSHYPVDFDNEALTLVWARRFATYKRPDLLLNDEDRLNHLTEKYGPIQIIYSGKAHPADEPGKALIQQIYHKTKNNSNKNVRKVFIEDYNTDISKRLVGGADVWLNTPRRPEEASGTSGMKAALNGCINLSSYDGWIVEAYEMNPKGIILVGPKSDKITLSPHWEHEKENKIDTQGLAEGLEEILGMYYYNSTNGNNEEMAIRRKESIKLISYFNTHRLAKEQAIKLFGRSDFLI